ncbi:MAG: hypothetical protein ACK56I_01285, partial [bacterium]
ILLRIHTLDDIEHACHLRKDEHARALRLELAQQCVQRAHLPRVVHLRIHSQQVGIQGTVRKYPRTLGDRLLRSASSERIFPPSVFTKCSPSTNGGPGSSPWKRYGWLQLLRNCIT